MLAVVLLIAGGLLELIAVLGLCVMRDVYDRLHYVGVAGFGALLIGIAIVVRESFSLIGDKALLVGVVLVLTGPVMVQTTARSLLIRDLGDWRAKTRGQGRTVTVLQTVALAAVALGGGAVVAAKDPLRQALVLSIYGLALTMLFFVFQAPDVALSEIVVSTVGLPVMLLLALRKIREHERARRDERPVSRTARLLMFGVGAAGLGVLLVYGLGGIPAFGHYQGVYGRVLDGIGVAQRHATDLVTGLNFDFRAFDTLGEEFILFASVLGIVLILREMRDEHERPRQEEADEHQFAGASSALRALALGLIPSMIALGVYIVVHGQITPGGGFQGGVILATGPLVAFLSRSLSAHEDARATHGRRARRRGRGRRLRADRTRRARVHRRVLQELPPTGDPRAPAVSRADRRCERRRRARGERRLPRRLERVLRPGDPRQTRRGSMR